jgi:hypothetical protein
VKVQAIRVALAIPVVVVAILLALAGPSGTSGSTYPYPTPSPTAGPVFTYPGPIFLPFVPGLASVPSRYPAPRAGSDVRPR